MGIKNFGREYLRNHSGKFLYVMGSTRVSTVSFDLNALVYRAIEKVGIPPERMGSFLPQGEYQNAWAKFVSELYTSIKEILLAFQPEDAVYLAYDGPTPVGKILQQRERRFVREANYGSYIIPGSNFMIALDVATERMIEELKKQDLCPPTFLYSSCFEEGEGEHKIMDYYRHLVPAKSAAKNNGGVHVIVSPDADILMLTLVSPLPNIVFVRSLVSEYEGRKTLKLYYYDIEAAKEHIKREHAITPVEFTFLFFLFGNDFLPRQLLFNGRDAVSDLESMLNFFKGKGESRGILVDKVGDEYQVRVDTLLELLAHMKGLEMQHFPGIAAKMGEEVRYGLVPGEYKEKTTDFRRLTPITYNPFEGARLGSEYNIISIENIWYGSFQSSFDQTITANLVSLAGNLNDDKYRRQRLYWQTLLWNLRYYTQGTKKVNHDLHYHYVAAPSFRALHEFLSFDAATLATTAHHAYQGMQSFNVLHQLLSSVSQRFHVNAVPPQLGELYRIESPIADYTCVDHYHKDVYGRVLQFPIDRWRVIAALKTLPLPSEDFFMQYAPRSTVYHNLSQVEANRYFKMKRRVNIAAKKPMFIPDATPSREEGTYRAGDQSRRGESSGPKITVNLVSDVRSGEGRGGRGRDDTRKGGDRREGRGGRGSGRGRDETRRGGRGSGEGRSDRRSSPNSSREDSIPQSSAAPIPEPSVGKSSFGSGNSVNSEEAEFT